jgi:uncharacterized delta-60 repeat protein
VLRPTALVLVLAGLSAVIVVPAPSALSSARGVRIDRSFGRGQGFVRTPIVGTDAVAYGAIVVPGGDIVVAGQASPPSGNGQVLVVRYLPNGRLDTGFGSRGILKTVFPVADAPFIATAIARDPRTGKLVIAGGYGQGSMLVMRVTARGRLDPTFGANRRGFATVEVGGIADALAIQPNGGILLGGSNANLNGRPFVVARFTRAGVLDRGFGHRGIAQALFWNPSAASSAGVNSLVTAPDGSIIASGHIDYIGGTGPSSGGHGSAGVFRLSRTGLPFRAFGTGGHMEITFYNRVRVPESWYPCAMTVDRRSRIMVTGGGGTHRFALFTARLTPRGALDRSYGSAGNGRTSTPGVGGNAITTCGITSTRAGLMTVGVQSTLAQLLPNGRPNMRFAPGGVFTIAKPKQVFINALIGSGLRRIVVAGSAGNAIYVARYLLPAAQGQASGARSSRRRPRKIASSLRRPIDGPPTNSQERPMPIKKHTITSTATLSTAFAL